MDTTPTVVRRSEGPSYWVLLDQLTFKVGPEKTGNQFVVADTVVMPGGGPPPHIHRREDELFYVLEGEFDFIFADTAFHGGPGTAVYAPRDIVHTFHNGTKQPGRLFLITTPSGFEKFYIAAGTACACGDLASAPAVTQEAIGKLMGVCAQFGIEMLPDFRPGAKSPAPRPDRQFWALGNRVDVKLAAEDTRGNFSLSVVTLPSGGAVRAHSHKRLQEVFYVLDGNFSFNLHGQTVPVSPGDCIHVPPGTVHGYTNTTTGPARLLDCISPGGFERLYSACGAPCIPGSMAPPCPQPQDLDLLRKTFEQHDMYLA